MRASKLLFLSLALTLVVSCSRSGEEAKKSDGVNATFLVDPVIGIGEEATADNTFANVATSRLINFTACLKDVAVQEIVVGAAFTLADESGSPIPLKSPTTDHKGCLYWSEEISFQGLQQETHFEKNRTFTATSIHKGSVTVKLAVNPWRSGSESVKDTRFHSVPRSHGGDAQASRLNGSAFVVQSVGADLEIVRSNAGVAEANMLLSFEPKVRKVDLSGAQRLESLTTGKFLVRAQLFTVSAGTSQPISAVTEFKESYFQRGAVHLRSKIQIVRRIPRESSLMMSFEAVPLNAPEGLAPVSGRVNLGRLTSLSLSVTRPLEPAENVAFEETKPSPQDTGTPFGFEMGRARVYEAVVKELDGTGMPKLLELKMKACLRNSASLEKVQGMDFTVTFLGKTRKLTTDTDEGCLKWSDNFAFNFHGKETLQKQPLIVRSANDFYGRQETRRFLHLNLWKYDSVDKIVIDEEIDGAPAVGVSEAGSGSELVLSNTFFNFLGRGFHVDPHLNLTTTRTYRFEIVAKIRRLSRDRGWLPPMGTGNGRYEVRFLLETLDPHNPQVIDAQTIQVESKADVIPATVTFHIHDIRQAMTRMNLSLEVRPLDKATKMETRPYSGGFDMVGGFTVRFEPRAGKIDERMKEAKRKNAALNKKGKDIFANANGHTVLGAKELQALGISEEDLEKYFTSGDAKSVGKLCALFHDPNGWFSKYKSCASNPETYLAMLKTDHINKVHGARVHGNIETSALSMFAGLNYSQSESDDQSSSRSQTKNFESGVKLSVPLIELLGVGIGFGGGVSDNWSTSTSHSRSRSRGQSTGADHGKQMLVDKAQFEINADLDRCLVFADKSMKKGKKAYMACGSPKRSQFKETYYLVYQDARPGVVVDPGAPLDERPFVALIRGEKRFQTFAGLMKDPEVTLNFHRGLPAPADIMREAENRFDGFFPGLLTLPE